MTVLVDSHCHLDFPDFEGDLEAVVARAHAASVTTMVTICTRVSQFDRVLAIAEAHDGIYCTVGIHPHNVAAEPEVTAEHLVRLAAHPKVVGFGETGLDYHYEHSPREAQQNSFRAHIAAARRSGLPVVVHSREADEDMARILIEEQGAGSFPGLIHCFSSGTEMAQRVVDLGLYVSFSGIVTFKQANALRDAARTVPVDRLLVETDAPYLAPVPKRGKRNEPAFTAYTAAHLADVRGLATDALAAATTENFLRLFTKARGGQAAADAEPS